MNKENLYLSTIAADCYSIAKKYGLGIEIADFCTAWNMDDEFDKTDKKLKANLEGIDRVVLHAPFNELFPCAIDKKARELAKLRYNRAIELSNRYKARKVIIHGGYNPYIYYPRWYVTESVVFWKGFLKEIPSGTQIVLENVLEETPNLLCDIVKGVGDDRLKLCLDIGHVNAYSKVSVSDWLEYCGKYISHFHIHNNDGSFDSHSQINDGNINMNEFFLLADKLCPDATYTLEITSIFDSVKALLK